jgi:hypothetical protein
MSELKTCGRCRHLDGAPVPRLSSRQVHYCNELKTWQFAWTPRGEPGELHCDKWSEMLAKPDTVS